MSVGHGPPGEAPGVGGRPDQDLAATGHGLVDLGQGQVAAQDESQPKEWPVPGGYAGATRDVLYVMAAIMAVAALVALRGLTRGVQQEEGENSASPLAREDPDVDLHPAR